MSWERYPTLHPRAVIVQTGRDSRLITALEAIKQMRPKSHPMLILSGGSSTNPEVLKQGFSTAEELQLMVPRKCRDLGISVPRIILDKKASNTKESAHNVLLALKEHGVYVAVIAMTPEHALRCLLTMRKVFDDFGGRKIILLMTISQPNFTFPEMEDVILGEIRRIREYSAKGDCYPNIQAAIAANPQAWPLQ